MAGPGAPVRGPAVVNPGSIGAGAEPPASRASARKQWTQFVDDCQTATDHRVLIAVPVLVVSVVVGVIGLVALWRRLDRPQRPASPPVDRWPLPPDGSPGPPPYAAPFPGGMGATGPPGGITAG